MEERYSVLFKLELNLYTKGAPLLISAGQLLKDNDTGAVLGQIKLQNISPNTVSSATVRFEPFDPAGRSAGEAFEHRYMDLNCARDAFCANREVAPFPDAAARRFNVSVREVIFSDGSIWTMPENAVWETLPEPQVRKSFADKYAEKAYLSKFPGASKWKAEAVRDRWYCGCGVLNAGEEKSCHACKKEFSAFSVSEKDLAMQGKYAAANGCLKSGKIEFLQQASALFKELGDYENAPAAAAEADSKISEILKKEKEAEEARAREEAERRAEEEARKKRKKRRVIFFIMLLLAAAAYMFIIKPAMAYSSASSLLENGQYSEAKTAFLALETYKDSPQMAKECDYRAAKALFDKGEYEKAKAAFDKLGNYSDAETMVKECDYQAAQALYAKKDYAGAAAAFINIKGYKDVDTLLATDDNLKAAAAAAALDAAWQPGKYVTFGTYEQDNNKNNGKEAIEWLVLARNGSKALVLSKYGLDAKPYNKKTESSTWEKCTLRSWLNGEFYNTAFTAAEQARIQLTSVDNSKAQGYSGYSTNGGNDTQDRVFLLSYAEANKYLGVTYDNSSNTASRVSPTAYAKANGAYVSNSNKTAEGANAGWWRLRSPGGGQDDASGVDDDGSLYSYYVFYDSGVVRPALWVEIS